MRIVLLVLYEVNRSLLTLFLRGVAKLTSCMSFKSLSKCHDVKLMFENHDLKIMDVCSAVLSL